LCVFAKTQGKNNSSAGKKTQGLSDSKLNLPVVFYNLSRKNSSFVMKIQDFCLEKEKI